MSTFTKSEKRQPKIELPSPRKARIGPNQASVKCSRSIVTSFVAKASFSDWENCYKHYKYFLIEMSNYIKIYTLMLTTAAVEKNNLVIVCVKKITVME